MTSLYAQLEIPEATRAISIQPDEGEFIRDFLAGREITATLETGFAYGCSTAFIMAGSPARHVAVDPWPERYDEIGMRNMERLGFADRLEVYRELAIKALPALAARGDVFDFFFVDGSHLFEDVILDWCFANLLVKPGGHVLFHDRYMKSVQYAAGFIRNNRPDWREVAVPSHLHNLYLFEKLDVPAPGWYEMKDFGAERPRAPERRRPEAPPPATLPRQAKVPAHIARRLRGMRS